MSTRAQKLGNLETIRKEIATLESQAANHLAVVEMKTVVVRKDYTKIDSKAILQAARDLDHTVETLREARKAHDELHEELYG